MGNKILNSNLGKRVITALILIPIVIFIIIRGGKLLDLFFVLIFIISTYEIITIVNNDKKMFLSNKTVWIISTLAYVGLALYCLRCVITNKSGLYFLHFLLSIWIFDTAAYFTGSLVGGPKLCPKISPKKTWSGLFGGSIVTFFFPAVYGFCYELIKNNFALDFSENVDPLTVGYLVGLGFFAMFSGLIGQIGDLLESWFKRKFGVKDSGNILPGHGGVLDRMDSLFFAGIAYYLMLQFNIW